MSSREPLHELTDVNRIRPGIDDEMDVVGHQAVAINLDAELVATLAQCGEVCQSIAIHDEYVAPVVTALHDMVRVAHNDQARLSRHPCPSNETR
jgi:DNA-binding protein YbaB